MANKRLAMRRIREILRLVFDCGLSQSQVAESQGIARFTVAEYLRRATTAGLTWPFPADIDDAALEQLLFPPRSTTAAVQRPEPDYQHIHRELKRPGVNLQLLWHEYIEQHANGYRYAAFCHKYREWASKLNISMRQVHKAGDKTFSDFAGTTIPVVIDRTTGEAKLAHLFVTALGASGFAFGKAFWSEDSESWCYGHVAAFEYFGGAPHLIVPDNPKAAILHASRYEPEINAAFQEMSRHYGAAVMPARVRHPKDKSKAEATVRFYTTWIIARLRDRTFFSLHELNVAIAALADELNNRPFKKLPGSRRELFDRLDKPALQQLPAQPYTYAQLRKARVGIDYHVLLDGCSYSVPYQLAREEVELNVTAMTVEVLFKGRRVASHAIKKTEQSSTLKEHMPPAHRFYAEWSPERFLSWAAGIGPSTTTLIEQHLRSAPHKEIAFRRCMGILQLAKSYSKDRLEAAAQKALATGAVSYRSVKSMLQTGFDRKPLPPNKLPVQLTIVHENVRGADYFTTKENTHAVATNDPESEAAEAARDGRSARIPNANT